MRWVFSSAHRFRGEALRRAVLPFVGTEPPPRPAAAAAALQALGALRNLAFDAENAAEAVREGGIQAIIDT